MLEYERFNLLDVATAKVLVWCYADVLAARDHGTTGPVLFSICCSLRIHLHQDVQENESYNSLLKKISARCPNIGIVLLAARVNIKKGLGLGI